MTRNINILLTSFPGLDLPKTLVIQVPSSASIAELTSSLHEHFPAKITSRLIITTTSNKQLHPASSQPVTTLLDCDNDGFLPLRLSAPLCGGKGGFGSQLRAAGGRMSSRRGGRSGENNGSNRNLDGRRLRTVAEAKALAEYMVTKPEMERREKEERRQRLEAVLEAAEKKEAEVKGAGAGRVSGKWLQDRDEGVARVREAVKAAIKRGGWTDNLTGGNIAQDQDVKEKSPSDDSGDGTGTEDTLSESASSATVPDDESPRQCYWNEFDDYGSSDDDSDEDGDSDKKEQ